MPLLAVKLAVPLYVARIVCAPAVSALVSKTGLEPEPVDSKARAEWHRVSWHELERRRRALERASGSAPNLAKG